MKTKTLVFLIILFTFCQSCSKDQSPSQEPDKQEMDTDSDNMDEEEVIPLPYFTLISNRPKSENLLKEWVVIHDSQGELLDYSLFDVGDNLEFTSEIEVSEILSITEIKMVDNGSGNSFTITTSTGVSKGSEWVLDPPMGLDNFYDSPGAEGTFNMDITGIPLLEKMTITNTKLNLSTGYSAATYPGSPPNTELSTDISLFTGENDYYVTILDGFNQLKYYDFTYDNMDISLDYSNFKVFDAYHSVNLPEHNFYIFDLAGFKEGYPYSEKNGVVLHEVLSFPYPNLPTQPFVYGYLDIFERYRTLFVLNYRNLHFFTLQYGPRLAEIEIPNPIFSITDESRKSFRYTVDVDHHFATHRWFYSEGSSVDNNLIQVYWYVKSDEDFEPLVGDLPSELLDEYPEIIVDNLAYDETTLNLPIASTENNSRSTLTIKKE